MKRRTQKEIAASLGMTSSQLSDIINRRCPDMRWKTAKRCAEGTGTDPVLWCEGTTDDIKKALGLK